MLVAGSTCTSMPCSLIRAGVDVLIPRSSAATRKPVGPTAGTTYGFGVVTAGARSAPIIAGLARTRSSSASTSSAASLLPIPQRMEPRSRRCRVSARVSTPAMPTTPAASRSSSRDRSARQLLAIRDGSRTT